MTTQAFQKEAGAKRGRLVIIQPTIPHYRRPFFNALSQKSSLQMIVIASLRGTQHCVETFEHDDFGTIHASSWGFAGNVLNLQCLPRWVCNLDTSDVLMINGNPRFLTNLAALWFARARNVPTIWWGHGWTAGSNGTLASIRRAIMRFPDVILLYTDEEKRAYEALGFDPDRLYATNNTIDLAPAKEARQNLSEDDKRIPLSEGGLEPGTYFLFIGRITPKCGLSMILDAIALLKTTGIDVGLAVIGDGPGRVDLERRASDEGTNVHFVGPMFDEGAIAPWLAGARAFVYGGAVGLSLMHAYAYGVPAVLHDDAANHMPEYAAFNDGENGLAFRSGDVHSLARTMETMLDLPDHQYSALRENAAATVEQRYTLDAMVERTLGAVQAARDLRKRQNSSAL